MNQAAQSPRVVTSYEFTFEILNHVGRGAPMCAPLPRDG